jgi:16S rRNA (uracil1498-N3)-methyltransferase
MRTIRIFQEGNYTAGQTIELSADAGQHVGVVLRMQVGMPLTLFSGNNREFLATISEVRKKKVMVTIQNDTIVNRESPRAIHLAQALAKGDRMEWIIQKAVELGVTSLSPIITSHCAVRLDDARMIKKQQQWQAIAISACEQSGRNCVPTVHPIISFESYLLRCHAAIKLILEPTAKRSWRDIMFADGDIALLIGPEGGLSEDEVLRAQAQEFKAVTLGPRILRTETAAITALSVLQAMAGDL